MARFNYTQIVAWVKMLFKSTQEALLETAEAVNERMSIEGDPITYPVQWDSERQKRAYYATDGFGAGIPYQRTQTYINSGVVTAKPYGAQYFRPHPAGAIGGTLKGWQSSIHVGRWTYLPGAIEIEVAKLPKRIRDKVQVNEGELDASS